MRTARRALAPARAAAARPGAACRPRTTAVRRAERRTMMTPDRRAQIRRSESSDGTRRVRSRIRTRLAEREDRPPALRALQEAGALKHSTTRGQPDGRASRADQRLDA